MKLWLIRITSQVGAISLLIALIGDPCVAQDSHRLPLDGIQRSTTQIRQVNPDRGRPALQRRGWRYRIVPGDVLEVSFVLTPEFDQVIAVQPDGYVTLKGVGSLRVQGQTTAEITQTLQTAYGKILRDPIITINLNDFAKPYFTVGGQVEKPGKFELRGDTTVTEAVAIAGGFKDTAKHSQVLLCRKVSDEWAEVKVLNVKHMLNTGNLAEDVHLQPGDMLYVPKNFISKINRFIPVPATYFDLSRHIP